MKASLLRSLFALFCAIAAFSAVPAQDLPAGGKGKPPIIIIPGVTGSELINKETGKRVWFSARRAKDDDIRLPISPDLSANRDNLIPGDIIREVRIIKILPEVEIYERLIDALNKRGYREIKWDDPGENAHQDTFLVFPYDWRRDNVETARLLIRRIEDLKKKIGKPDLKFNLVAHSMGGLIARYAAMYGDADIPAIPRPTWAGARDLDRIFLLGTPNEGSVSALDALLNGMSYIGGGLNIPFVRDINRFDVFTAPSVFQLLPHDNSLTAYDEHLKPVKIDIYDPSVWVKYRWAIWQDENFMKRFDRTERDNARAYFRAALLRAKRFQAALNANSRRDIPVSFYLIGSECKETANALIVRRDPKNAAWITQFKPKDFKRADGTKVSGEALRPLLYSGGDGVVTKQSLAARSIVAGGLANTIPMTAEILQCESHTKLVTNAVIQDKLFEYLGLVAEVNKPVQEAQKP